MLGNRVAQHTAAIDAAAAAGVGHVIYTSVVNAGSALPLVVSHEHGATEQAIRDRGLRWTALRNGLYAEFQVGAAARAAASGQLVHNSGDGATAYVSREDCAAAAAAVLDDRRPRGSRLRHHGPRARHAGRTSRRSWPRSPAAPSRRSPSTTTRPRRPSSPSACRPRRPAAYASFGTAIREGVLDGVSTAVRRPHRPRAA